MPPGTGTARNFWLASTKPQFDLSRFAGSVRCRSPCSHGGGEYVGSSASVEFSSTLLARNRAEGKP